MEREEHIQRDNSCFQKAVARGQMTFTLVEQDESAVHTIGFWILRNIETAPKEKLIEALEAAILMRDFPSKKEPD